MTKPDVQIKESIKGFLKTKGLRVEDIPEETAKTPDFWIDRGETDGSLLEIKTKQDDPDELAAISAELDSAERDSVELDSRRVVMRRKPIDYWNRLDGIISSGVKQFQEKDPAHLVPRFIWIHCEGRDAELYATRLKATLYGTQKLVSEQIKAMVTCYYFWNSSFFKHKNFLEGVVISQGNKIQLNLNDHSSHFALAQNSSLAKAFQAAAFYPQKDKADTDLINDFAGDRKDEQEILAYLRIRYSIDHLQIMPMNQITGAIRTHHSSGLTE